LDVFLLFTHRSDNLNMSSTWLCSRNDLIANVGVLLAVGGSYLLESRWPDIVAGLIIAGLFLVSAIDVLKQSITALRVLDPVDPIVKPSVIQLEQLRRISSKSESGMK
jgi:Co/Zn/Cd efflux system component